MVDGLAEKYKEMANRVVEDNQSVKNVADGVRKQYGEVGVEVFKVGLAVGYLIRGSEDWWK